MSDEMNVNDRHVVDGFMSDKKKLGLSTEEKPEEGKDDKEDPADAAPKEDAADEPAKPEEGKDEKGDADEEKSEKGDEPEDKSEEDDAPGDKKFVPVPDHNKLKRAFRDYRRETKETIDGLKAKIDEFSKTKDPEEKDAIEDEIKAAAEKLGVEPESIKIIVDIARKGLEPKKVDEKVDEAIDKAANKDAEIDLEEEKEYFNGEWAKELPALKLAYPSATDAQLEKAKADIDKISHSKDFNTFSLDYVIFKNKKILDTHLFSPKKKGLDAGQISRKEGSESKEYKPLSAKSSPKEIAEREKELREMAEGDSEGVTIIDNDGSERIER